MSAQRSNQPDFAAENQTFEKVATEKGMRLDKLPGGFYVDPCTQHGWSSWIHRSAIALGVQAERDHLKSENEALRRQAETAQRGAGQLQEENEALRAALGGVRESVQREYWDEYAGLEEARAILDAAMGKAVQP